MSDTPKRREIDVRNGRLVVCVNQDADGTTVEFTPTHNRRVTLAVVVRGDEALSAFARAVVNAVPGALATACAEFADQLESAYHHTPDVLISALERVQVEA